MSDPLCRVAGMDESENLVKEILGRCRDDDAFKRRLLADPAATLRAHGWELTPGVLQYLLQACAEMPDPVISGSVVALDDELLGAVAAGANSYFKSPVHPDYPLE